MNPDLPQDEPNYKALYTELKEERERRVREAASVNLPPEGAWIIESKDRWQARAQVAEHERDEARKLLAERWEFLIAALREAGSEPTDDPYDDVRAALAERAVLRQERNDAIRLMSQYAREAGEAKGRLEMSEAAGIVDGWRERAEAAEARLAQHEPAQEVVRGVQVRTAR